MIILMLSYAQKQKIAFVVLTRTFIKLKELWTLLVGYEAKLLIEHNLTRLYGAGRMFM